MKDLAFIAIMTGRAMRAHARSVDTQLPKSQRDFHAGRREAYLQAIAVISEVDVKDIREGVLGTKPTVPSDVEVTKFTTWVPNNPLSQWTFFPEYYR